MTKQIYLMEANKTVHLEYLMHYVLMVDICIFVFVCVVFVFRTIVQIVKRNISCFVLMYHLEKKKWKEKMGNRMNVFQYVVLCVFHEPFQIRFRLRYRKI